MWYAAFKEEGGKKIVTLAIPFCEPEKLPCHL